ncbi:hypothetical protein [Roseibium aggregatum]|jgi:hypothetical protein|uniref:Uncharacterized protein n=1 Tax=Roseibium aggregatum TaxID=187304 RepID=A0A0M6YAZ0_9HYPH|nr:hypothetical protein [Roseibium aggregatum]CTQ47245.1 hypothetical protein LAL4801_05707 [Roseibium aggregatum]
MEDKFSEFFTWLDQQVGRAVWGVLEPDERDETVQRGVTGEGNTRRVVYVITDSELVAQSFLDEIHITVRDNGQGIEFVDAMHVEEVRDPDDALVPLMSTRWIFNSLEQAVFHSTDEHRIFYEVHQACENKYSRLRDRRNTAFERTVQPPGYLMASMAAAEVARSLKHTADDPRTLIDVVYRETATSEYRLLIETDPKGNVRSLDLGNRRVNHRKLSDVFDNDHFMLSPDGPLATRLKELAPLFSGIDRLRRGLIQFDRAA